MEAKQTVNRSEFRDFDDIVANAARLQRRIWEQQLDDRRDIDDECGYPSTGELTVQYYRRMYDREGVANRIVSLFPDECWLVHPTVFEDDDPSTKTPFEQDFDNIGKKLMGESWYESDEGHPIWEYCHRIDTLSGIGHFGVLLLGTDHGGGLEEPIEFTPGQKSHELLYLRAFDESLVEIASRDLNDRSPRFMQPEYYNLEFEQITPPGQVQSQTKQNEKRRVHWSRVIHVAEKIEANEIFAVPRLRPNYNRCYDLRKIYGGSGEGFWRAAVPWLFFQAFKELGTEVEMTSESKDVIEQMMSTLQRYGFVPGVEPKLLAPTPADPMKQIDAHIDAICIQMGVPKRIFMGSERGELASSQDARAWNKRISGRHNRYLIPRLTVPLIDRLIQIGCLTMPEKYKVEFPDLNSLTEQERAEIAVRRTESLTKFIQGDGESAMTLMDYFTIIQGMTDDEAQGIVDRRMDEERMFDEPEPVNLPPQPVKQPLAGTMFGG